MRHLLLSALLALPWLLLSANDSVLRAALREDGPIESAGAGCLLAAAGILAASAWRSAHLRRVTLGLAAIFFFVAAGEELSWGQRLLGVETPAAIQSVNAQGELNLHNLQWFHGGALDSGRIFTLLVAFPLAVVPIACRASSRLRRLLSPLLPAVSWTVALPFVLTMLMSKIATASLGTALPFHGTWPVVHCVTELRESLVAVAVAIWACEVNVASDPGAELQPAEARA